MRPANAEEIVEGVPALTGPAAGRRAQLNARLPGRGKRSGVAWRQDWGGLASGLGVGWRQDWGGLAPGPGLVPGPQLVGGRGNAEVRPSPWGIGRPIPQGWPGSGLGGPGVALPAVERALGLAAAPVERPLPALGQ